MTTEELENIITGYLDSFTTMTVACSGEDLPWAAAVYYARQGLDLVFFSSPSSRHASLLEHNPEAAATIHGDYRGWKEIKGLQLEGRVERITSTVARTRALSAYVRRHPFVSEFLSDPLSMGVAVARKVSRVELYVFQPRTIWYIDNEAGFGKRWRLEVEHGRGVGKPTQG